MIHYILLPAEERHALRREYRMRLAIVIFLFVSIAMVFGIVSILPSYVYTYNQENELLLKQEALNKSRTATGAAQSEKNLTINNSFAQKIIAEADPLVDTAVISKLVSLKRRDMAINSFQIDHALATSTLGSVMLRGTSGSRESLLEFKKALEGDKMFTSVLLPLSDFAKSKNIDFTVTVKIRK